LVFQAGVDLLTLSQSVCNDAAHAVWLYGVPRTLCSNHFQLVSEPAAPTALEDEEYLAQDLLSGSLPLGVVWFDAVKPRPGHSLSDGQESKGTVASDSET
jgi:hypothetical protein